MRRSLTFSFLAALVLALALTSSAVAGGGSLSNDDYQGRIEKDKGTLFAFNVDKKNGVTKIAKIQTVIKLQCTDGDGGQIPLQGKDALRVHDDGSFAGKQTTKFFGATRGVDSSTGTIATKGKLKKHGQASGTVDVTYDFTESGMRGNSAQHVHCYSGAVQWKAKRGATVNPQGPQPRARFG